MASLLTDQERKILQDQMKREEDCARRYRNCAGQVSSTWESTAKQLLFEQERQAQEIGQPFQASGSKRSPHWGGMLPGDTPDVNHGDLTRGGLDRRGVNLHRT